MERSIGHGESNIGYDGPIAKISDSIMGSADEGTGFTGAARE